MQNTGAGAGDGWEKYYDSEAQAYYYFNPTTREAKWINPSSNDGPSGAEHDNSDDESDLNSLSSRIKSEIKSEIINKFDGIVSELYKKIEIIENKLKMQNLGNSENGKNGGCINRKKTIKHSRKKIMSHHNKTFKKKRS